MKRSPELQPLSRDHHRALYAALRLRRADAETAAGAADGFLDFWREHGQRHFEIEEQLLLPAFVRGGGDARDEVVARVLMDHVEIRARARSLDASSSLEEFHQLGELLADHVRIEEDKLFPLVERTLDSGALTTLGVEVERAESRGTPTS